MRGYCQAAYSGLNIYDRTNQESDSFICTYIMRVSRVVLNCKCRPSKTSGTLVKWGETHCAINWQYIGGNNISLRLVFNGLIMDRCVLLTQRPSGLSRRAGRSRGCSPDILRHTVLSNENGEFYTYGIYPYLNMSVCLLMGSPTWWRFSFCSRGSSFVCSMLAGMNLSKPGMNLSEPGKKQQSCYKN